MTHRSLRSTSVISLTRHVLLESLRHVIEAYAKEIEFHKLFEPTDQAGIHAAKLAAPFVIRCAAHAVFTAQNGYWRARLALLQDGHDGAVAVLGSFHEKSFCPAGLEILLLHGAFFRGDYQ